MKAAILAIAAFALPLAAQFRDGPFPAHKVIGNVYYVGSQQLASYLITTLRGHILINSSFEETVPLIRASVEELGFRFQDIRILLDSHAHSDHVAGSALVRELTAARVMVMQGDEGLVRSGGKGDFRYDSTWKPCKVDRVLRDGEEVSLDDTTLIAHHTPGHTKGATTWTLKVFQDGKTYDVVIHSSTSVNPGYKLVHNAAYPQIAEDYRRSFRVLKALVCDVFLAPHGAQYGLPEKYKRIGKGPNPFIDPAGYRAFVDRQEQTFLEKWKEQGGSE